MDIRFNDDNARQFVSAKEIGSLQMNVDHSHNSLEKKTGQGE